jgi:hypothetical protein
MSQIVVATTDELRLLTKRERQIYELYRHEGKTREEICAALKIGKDAFRRYWWSAIKRIQEHRKLTQNPQYFMAKGQDVLAASKPEFQRTRSAEGANISNVSQLGKEIGLPEGVPPPLEPPTEEVPNDDDESAYES